jgi:competence protein ComFB
MAAKKSNKTEHVLKLITKNDEASQEDDYFGIDQEITASEIEPKIDAQKPAELPQEVIAEPVRQETPAEPVKATVQETPAEPVKATVQEPPAEPVKQEPQQSEPPLIRAFREQEHATTRVNTDSEQDDDLVNIAELLAREKLALVMERMKVCSCQTCKNDVLALALNSLPTKYVTTDAGKQYFQRDVYKKQYETDILAALTKACVRVKASPRH